MLDEHGGSQMGVAQHESTTHFQPDGQSLLDEHGGSHPPATLAQKPVPSVVLVHRQSMLFWQTNRLKSGALQKAAQLQSPSVSVLSGGHAGVKQLAHLPRQSQGWFSRWRRRSRLLTQSVRAFAKSHSSVSRSKGTWQTRTQSSSARALEGISAARAVPAKSFSARRRLSEP